jgi:hypothetical protein
MKKYICILVFALVIALTGACSDSSQHVGEAKTPSGSSIQKGKDYKEVIELFKANGFTNIKTETIEDLIIGWLTKDGEVEHVSVGGNKDYLPDRWYPNNVEVIISYHTFPIDDSSDVVKETETNKKENVVEETSVISNKIQDNYSEVNQNLSERLLECQGWALGLLDRNGDPTKNGTPSQTHSFSLLIIEIKYTGDKLIIMVLDDFKQLDDEKKTYVINMAQGNASAVLEDVPYTKVVYTNGNIAGYSKITNNKAFKWN